MAAGLEGQIINSHTDLLGAEQADADYAEVVTPRINEMKQTLRERVLKTLAMD